MFFGELYAHSPFSLLLSEDKMVLEIFSTANIEAIIHWFYIFKF